MNSANLLAMQRVAMGLLCAGALATAACSDRGGTATSPGPSQAVSTLAASSTRNGDFHITKECGKYTGAPGSFCTITSSSIKEIEVGSRIVYARGAGATALDSDVVLDLPGPGNNTAFGHCRLDFATGLGLCTFSGGTGKFTWFHADAHVSFLGGPNWAWDGTYSFSPRD